MVSDGKVDYDKLGKTVTAAVHFLDNVVDINNYPLPIIEKQTKANRKIGLGVMGFADLLLLLETPYSSQKGRDLAAEIMAFVDRTAYNASIALAEKRGSFPNFSESTYGTENPTVPIRNATRTTIAPTGTISILAGCSSGVEPIFALAFLRRVMDDDELFEVNPIFESVARKNNFFSRALVKKSPTAVVVITWMKFRKNFASFSKAPTTLNRRTTLRSRQLFRNTLTTRSAKLLISPTTLPLNRSKRPT